MTYEDSPDTKEVLCNILNEKCHTFHFKNRNLILYFGAIINEDPLQTSWNLWIGCPWRLYNDQHVLAGYFDDPKKIHTEMSWLEGSILIDITHTDNSQDLELSFSNGLQMRVFTDSIMYEQWELRGANGYRYEIGPNLMPREYMDTGDT